MYPLSERLRNKHIDSKFICKIQQDLLRAAQPHIRETLPDQLLNKHQLVSKKAAINNIHFPKDTAHLLAAQHRLKFEELFFIQLRLIKMKLVRQEKFKGQIFNDTTVLTTFYNQYLPFALTEAQKRVVKEI